MQRGYNVIHALHPEFVDSIPKSLSDGKLYISKKYSTAVHKCCCGCGQKVVTPLRPTDWRLDINGGYVSLWPSIGNWSFPCRSHYWIVNNDVRWSYDMSQEEVNAIRRQDARAKDCFIRTGTTSAQVEELSPAPVETHRREGLWEKIKRWLAS